MEDRPQTFDSIDEYIASIPKAVHRAFAEGVVADYLPRYIERVAERRAKDEFEGKQGYWQMFLSRPESGFEGSGHPKVAWSVGEHIAEDIKRLHDHGSLNGSRYHRHLRQQKRRAAKRAETIRRNSGYRRPRDSQRSKLYEAERVLDDFISTEWGPGQVAEMQDWVDALLDSKWWTRRYGERFIEVTSGAGQRRALAKTRTDGWFSYKRKIGLPLWARKDWVVLHELAHHATDFKHGFDQVAAHGREFARIYVELVGHVMGKPAADALKVSFKEHSVKYSKPRKPMTPAQREAAAARLAAAREKL